MSSPVAWLTTGIIVVIGLYILATLTMSLIQTNPLFGWAMLGGGGVFGTIVAKAKGLF